MIAARALLASVLVLSAALALPGCRSLHPAGKAALTPLTVVRDLVDAPLVSLGNVFHTWAGRSSKVPRAGAGIGIGSGGVSPYMGIDFSYYIFTPLAWLFGGIDYLVCRSLWPQWPTGIGPFREPGEGWGSLYFPNTRALWAAPGEHVRGVDPFVEHDGLEALPPSDESTDGPGTRSGTEQAPAAEPAP